MHRLFASAATAVLLFAACDQADELVSDTSFGFDGRVVSAAAAAQAGAEQDEVRPGVMKLTDIDPGNDEDEDALGQCADAGDDETFTVFWTEETEFDPASVTDEAGFPQSLQGKTVTVDAEESDIDFTLEDEDEGEEDENEATDQADTEGECVLIAERIAVAGEPTASPAATRPAIVRTATPAPAPTPTPTPTVAPTVSPTATVGLPEETP